MGCPLPNLICGLERHAQARSFAEYLVVLGIMRDDDGDLSTDDTDEH
jgi:hypothetical protein